MAKAILPVNFKNDILAAAMNGSRKFKITDNGDGTVTLEDVSTYDQVGSEFGAAQMNATNQAVNDSVDKSKVLQTLEENAASTDDENVAGSKALAELNKKFEENFQGGVNTIVSAVNTKAGTSLTGANTPTEIADVIANIKTNAVITSADNYLQRSAGITISMTKGIIVCYWANSSTYAFYVLEKNGTSVSVKTNYNSGSEYVFSHSNVTANSIYIQNVKSAYSHVYQYVVTP